MQAIHSYISDKQEWEPGSPGSVRRLRNNRGRRQLFLALIFITLVGYWWHNHPNSNLHRHQPFIQRNPSPFLAADQRSKLEEFKLDQLSPKPVFQYHPYHPSHRSSEDEQEKDKEWAKENPGTQAVITDLETASQGAQAITDASTDSIDEEDDFEITKSNAKNDDNTIYRPTSTEDEIMPSGRPS